MEIWYKFRKYFILWAVLLLCLLIYTIVKHKEVIGGYIVGSVTSVISSIASVVLVIAIFVWIIRAMFR